MYSGSLALQADRVVHAIRGASADERIKLQPQLSRVVHDMELSGAAIPPKLRNLHEQLLEEVLEARFDNLPI